jgi:hypothetical protein
MRAFISIFTETAAAGCDPFYAVRRESAGVTQAIEASVLAQSPTAVALSCVLPASNYALALVTGRSIPSLVKVIKA